MENHKKILIIEDESTIINALKIKLQKDDVEILSAKNGAIGLQVALDTRPDLIVLDIIMPILDGMKMLDELRGDDWGKSVPVLILTNLSDDNVQAKAKELNVESYLVKADWNLSDIVKKIKSYLL